jgi:hypothetical protein
MPFFIAPIVNAQQFDSNGKPLSGGRVFTYLAGTTTPVATYTSESGTVAQANPIVLNTLGVPLSPIWLTNSVSIKFVIEDSLGNTLRTLDNVRGVNDSTTSQSEWIDLGLTPTFISGTSFSVIGDQLGTLQVGRRLLTNNISGLVYSTITASVFASGSTTVTVANDFLALDAGISQLRYGFLSVNPTSVPSISTLLGYVPVSAAVVNGSNRIKAKSGAAGPFFGDSHGFTFSLDNDTGLANPADGVLDLVSNGVVREKVINGELQFFLGSDFRTVLQTDGNIVTVRLSDGALMFSSYDTSRYLRNYYNGFVVSVSGAIITIGNGQASNSTNTVLIDRGLSGTKTTAPFVAGAGNGCLDTGAFAANTYYRVFPIRRPDTGTDDVVLSLSKTAPTLTAPNLVPFTQFARASAVVLTNAAGNGFAAAWNFEGGTGRVKQLLATYTLAGAAFVDVPLPFDDFQGFILSGEGLRPTVNAEIRAQLINGSTAYGGVNDYFSQFVAGGGAVVASGVSGFTNAGAVTGTVNSTTPSSASFDMLLKSPKSTGSRLTAQTASLYPDDPGTNLFTVNYFFAYAGVTSGLNAARTGVRIICNGSTFAQGTLNVYGVRS